MDKHSNITKSGSATPAAGEPHPETSQISKSKATLPRLTPMQRQAVCFSLLLVLVSSVGCPQKKQRLTATPGLNRRSDRAEALLGTAIAQLRDLPSDVVTDLTPPQVILDSRTSSDGEDVLAVLIPRPGSQTDPPLSNYIKVTTGNANFRSLGVRSGDILKYYVDVDTSGMATEEGHFRTRDKPGSPEEESEDDVQWSEGFVREAAIDIPIAQVGRDNESLIIAVPFQTTVPIPTKIEVWRYSDERMREFGRRLARYDKYGDPRLGWEPTPDETVLELILDRLNPWSRQLQGDESWRVDPLLSTLPEALREQEQLKPYLTAEALANLSYTLFEVRLLQQAVWMRDISEWARGDSFDDLDRAKSLFDWAVRNIQLDPEDEYRPRWPWQTLFYGHGTAEQRAWVFALLCRQQGMDVVMLLVPEASAGGEEFWLPALVHKGELYLFDVRLGVPVPSEDGSGVATLRELQNNSQLLDALNVGDYKYSVDAAKLNDVTAAVVASYWELSQRARLFEAELTGEDRLVLSVNASEQAEAVEKLDSVSRVELWAFPFETLLELLKLRQSGRYQEALAFEPFAWRPNLYKARMYHFQGKKSKESDIGNSGLGDEVNSHQQAAKLYTSRRVRPRKSVIDNLTSKEKQDIYNTAKMHASYWLGLLSFDQGRYTAAEDYFHKRTLEDYPETMWSTGARYNLARTHEALGNLEEAIALYESGASPQRHGNMLRARRLRAEGGSESGGQDEEAATQDSALSLQD